MSGGLKNGTKTSYNGFYSLIGGNNEENVALARSSYSYDSGTNGIGRRTSSSSNGVTNSWVYDTRGRVSSETVSMGGSNYTTSMAYNSADLPTSMTYPDNETVNFTYTPQMTLDGLSGTSTYLSGTLYDAAGRVTQRSLGNGLTQEYTYNSWTNQGGRLANLTTGTLQDLTYSYDANGNIESIVDALNGPQTQSFAYDTLNRLTSAAATGGQNGLYNESYTYNGTTGNLVSKAGVSYTYDTNHPHAVASLSNGNSYSYDANGNMTQRVVNGQTFNLGYDAENRLVSVSGTGLSVAFTFDADGKRVQQVLNNVTTKFIGSHYEVEGTTISKYYLAGATRVAMRVGTSASVYFLQDHLGSTSLTTDSSGNLISQLLYKAWGEIRYSSGTTPTNYTYTGQYSNTADFGLMYYGARWYDSSLGRFAQPDNLVPGAGNPQAYDRYSYTNNNPSKYIDPTGHIACWDNNYDSSCALPENNPYDFNDMKSQQTPVSVVVIQKPNPYTFEPTPIFQPPLPNVHKQGPTSTPPYVLRQGPTSTPTPSQNSPSPQYKISVDWSKVDYIDLLIDGVGLCADLVSLIIPEAAPIAESIGTVVEGIGFGKSSVELVQGDPKSMFISQTTVAMKGIAIAFRLERMIPLPIIGTVGNLVSIYININPHITY